MEQQKEEERIRWRELLSEQQESGKSIAGFCRDHGLPVWQFYEWKKRLRSAEAEPFVAVEVVASAAVAAAASQATVPSTPIEIRLCGGRSLLVGPDFEASHLRRLLQVLEQEV
jgi:transposase-like protein